MTYVSFFPRMMLLFSSSSNSECCCGRPLPTQNIFSNSLAFWFCYSFDWNYDTKNYQMIIMLSFIYPGKIFSGVVCSFSKKNSLLLLRSFGAHPPRTRKTLLLLSNCYKSSMEEHPSHSQDVNISLRRVLVSDRSVIFLRFYQVFFVVISQHNVSVKIWERKSANDMHWRTLFISWVWPPHCICDPMNP